MINLNNTVSIIVLYDPNLNRLKRLLKSITSQVKVTYVIVNSALNNDIQRLINSFSNIKLFPLNENMGLAYAQNIGIQVAIEDHFKFAVLFDHRRKRDAFMDYPHRSDCSGGSGGHPHGL